MFYKKKSWPGIEKNTAEQFYIDLKTNYHKTVSDFLRLQTINSKKSSQDLIFLKKILFSETEPNLEILKSGLEMICSIDLRSDMVYLKVPLLRIYGALDSLVPKKIINILDKKWPNTRSITIEKAAHAPFISHQLEFCSILLDFKNLFYK